jgi:hypothetical protein
MVPRACYTRFLKIVFDSARDIRLLNISAHAQPAMKSIPRMLSQRKNAFRVCSASDEIHSAMLSMDLHVKTVHILLLAEHPRKFVLRRLSVR